MNKAKHLVLLPGLDGSGFMFKPFVDKCFTDEEYTVISYPNDRHIEYTDLADYIIPLLPRDKEIILLGESYSGPVAIQLATRNNLNIKSLILVATFSHYPNTLLKFVSLWLPYKYLLRLPVPDCLLKFVCFDRAADPSLLSLMRESLAYTSASIMSQRMSEGIRIDVREEVAKLTIPCTYIKAKYDKLVSKSAVSEIEKLNKEINIIEINGPHFILQTRINECCTVIKKLMY